MTVRLHIEQLVMEGLRLEAGERRALGDAVERELVWHLRHRAHPWPASSAAVRRVSAAPIHVAPSQAAPVLGSAIADSIHDGLGRALTL